MAFYTLRIFFLTGDVKNLFCQELENFMEESRCGVDFVLGSDEGSYLGEDRRIALDGFALL
tara:strand:- start:6149 stop:6331 length:183 start_codon:yes stop_codon:yes gene_type:complete